ncbi:YfcL family protein [Pseudocolwellia agarivorans]|uniref:YfcL family protein n=1 Tax=Pseudocolwellia agarivorans TaxID=1911682 RepID=UPI0009852B91|nr:YfcL family protein [Pseudocolwellia agarivorans]
MSIQNLNALYQHFDDLCLKENNDDELFASSYIRGFIALSASQFGDETQVLSAELANDISEKLTASRSELTPQDQQIISNYWAELKTFFDA